MLEQFEKIGKEALADLQKVTDLKQLEEFRIKYLVRKGQITADAQPGRQASARAKTEGGADCKQD